METERRIAALKEKTAQVKAKLMEMGPMRPGKLSRQYKDPKEKRGGYWQLSYTYQMKSRTEYVRPESVKRIRQETGAFKRFKGLMEEWISLELKISTLKTELEKGRG